MILRDYQNKAAVRIFEEWTKAPSTLAVLPTGCGKTVLFADIIQKMQPLKAMVLAHRSELIWQAKDKIERVTGLKADVEMGEYKSSNAGNLFHPAAQVIVSTIQTHTAGGDGRGRMTKFDPMDFGLLIIDESHRGVSPSYKKVIKYYQQNPNLKVLGVTATPDRADEEALGQIFDSVAFNYEILDAINDGWLVPIEQQLVTVESIDLSQVHTTAGDLNGGELNDVMMAEKPLHGVADSTIKILGDKRGIGFATSVEHARILADIFNRHRAGMAASISGKTDKDERKKIIADFACGKIQFLWNCDVFTEGFDDSGVEVIVHAAPTKSRAKYAQRTGRGTRPHESIASKLGACPSPAIRRSMISRSCKPSMLVIDFVGNSGKHKLMTTADILGGKVSDEVIEAAIAAAKKSGQKVRMDKSLEEEEKKLAEKKQREDEARARKHKLIGKAVYKSEKIDPFDLLQVKPSEPTGYDKGKSLSERMKKLLRNAGFNPDTLDYTKGKQLCGVLIDRWNRKLCSIGQAKILKKYGYNPDSTFEQAKKIIDAIAGNNWRPVANLEAKINLPTRKELGQVESGNPF